MLISINVSIAEQNITIGAIVILDMILVNVLIAVARIQGKVDKL